MKQAVIFDLDGVIVSTDEYHYQAWKELADEENIYFDKQINERLRGVSRMESLDILLEKAVKNYSFQEKLDLAERKNNRYKLLLKNISHTDILPGVNKTLKILKEKGIQVAIGSSSKNTPIILERIGLENYFDAVADGNAIKNSKPDPEVFLLAAKLLNKQPSDCIVVEDAYAGIDAAKAGGFTAVAVGFASGYNKADFSGETLNDINIEAILEGRGD